MVEVNFDREPLEDEVGRVTDVNFSGVQTQTRDVDEEVSLKLNPDAFIQESVSIAIGTLIGLAIERVLFE
jgi:hypothetical protein